MFGDTKTPRDEVWALAWAMPSAPGTFPPALKKYLLYAVAIVNVVSRAIRAVHSAFTRSHLAWSIPSSAKTFSSDAPLVSVATPCAYCWRMMPSTGSSSTGVVASLGMPTRTIATAKMNTIKPDQVVLVMVLRFHMVFLRSVVSTIRDVGVIGQRAMLKHLTSQDKCATTPHARSRVCDPHRKCSQVCNYLAPTALSRSAISTCPC